MSQGASRAQWIDVRPTRLLVGSAWAVPSTVGVVGGVAWSLGFVELSMSDGGRVPVFVMCLMAVAAGVLMLPGRLAAQGVAVDDRGVQFVQRRLLWSKGGPCTCPGRR